MALNSADTVLKFVTGMFGAAPGAYLDMLVAQYDEVGLDQLAINLGNTAQFRAIYPTAQGGHVFAGAFLAKMIPGYQPSNPAHLAVLNWLAGEFDRGVPAGQVLLQALKTLDLISPADPVWGATRSQWDQWVEVAHRVELSGGTATSLDELQGALQAPAFTSAEVNGSTLVLHYTDVNGLAPNPIPLATSFNVLVGGTSRTISSVAVNGSTDTVTLTLATAVGASDVVTVSYTDPTSLDDSRAVQDTYGNDAASLVNKAVTNNTPDVLGPVFASAEANGLSVILTYTDASALDATHVPAASAFTVTAGGDKITVTEVAVNATTKTVTLTLDTAVTDTQSVTVAYKDPTTGNDTAAVQDALGNDAASLTATKATNTTPDATGPVFDTGTVDGKTMVLTFKDASGLEDSSTSGPRTTAFTVKAGGVADAVEDVVIDADAKTVTLTLATAVTYGQTVTVAYADPTTGDDVRALQDGLGNDAATFTATEVENETADASPPVFKSATVNGSSLVMTYTENTTLDAGSTHLPLAGAFKVLVNGKEDTVSAVAVGSSAKTVTLTLATPVLDGQTVTVAYTDTTKDNDTRAIQDAAGNDAASLSATTVTNNSPDVTAPTFMSAAVDGNTLVMTYSDLHLLDAKNGPPTTAFTVTRGGVADTVNAVVVDASLKTVTLTLDTAVVTGETVKVAYADPTTGNDSGAIQDATGNDAAPLAATTVTNNTVTDVVAPVFAIATVNGNTLVMTYTESTTLDAVHPPAKGDFTVLGGVKGIQAVTVDSVTVDANAKTVTLTLAADSVQAGDVVTVAYNDPTTGNDGNAIQDAAGNDAANLPATAVTNQTPDTAPPVFNHATVNGSTLVLFYDDVNPLNATAGEIPIASQFNVTANTSTNVTVTSVTVGTATVTLGLGTAMTSTDTLALSYTDISGSNNTVAIQDLAGNDAISLVGVSVMNLTP